MSDIQEQDSEEEAGSMEVSQFEVDITRTHSGGAKTTPHVGKPDMENVLSGISSKSQLQETIKQVQTKSEEEEPQKISTTNNIVQPKIMTTSNVPETKKAGFSKLFEKSGKVKP